MSVAFFFLFRPNMSCRFIKAKVLLRATSFGEEGTTPVCYLDNTFVKHLKKSYSLY